MRLPTFLAATALVLVSLSLPPDAAALGCPGPNLRMEGPDGDIVTRSYYPACGFDTILNEGKECPDGEDDWNHVPLGLTNVYFNTCGDPDRGLLNNPFSLLPERPPVVRPFDACPAGQEAPDAASPHVRDDCNPDPHLTHEGNWCPNYSDHRTPVDYENVSVSYNFCYNLVPGISNPFYDYPSNVCGTVPEYNIVNVSPDCRRVSQEWDCPDGHEHPVRAGPYDGVVYHCGPV